MNTTTTTENKTEITMTIEKSEHGERLVIVVTNEIRPVLGALIRMLRELREKAVGKRFCTQIVWIEKSGDNKVGSGEFSAQSHDTEVLSDVGKAIIDQLKKLAVEVRMEMSQRALIQVNRQKVGGSGQRQRQPQTPTLGNSARVKVPGAPRKGPREDKADAIPPKKLDFQEAAAATAWD